MYPPMRMHTTSTPTFSIHLFNQSREQMSPRLATIIQCSK